MNAPLKKTVQHPQSILAVDASYVDMLGVAHGLDTSISISEFIANADAHYVIAQRERLEKDPRFRQLLPYIIIGCYVDGILWVAFYQRTKLVGESRLGKMFSIGWGGHIDLHDVLKDESVVKLMDTIDISTRREMYEEAQLHITTQNESYTAFSNYFPLTELGVLCDREAEVGLVHLGLLQLIIVDPNFGFESKEKQELIYNGFRPVTELAADVEANPGKFEPWSEWSIQELAKRPQWVYEQTGEREIELVIQRNAKNAPIEVRRKLGAIY